MRHALLVAGVVTLFVGTICRADDAAPTIDPSQGRRDGDVLWYDLQLFDIEGQGWDDTADLYDRLPARAKDKVRGAVWSLSKDSTGICARFVTDAPTIHARWTLTSSNLAMAHMPATGVSGLDLYVRSDGGKWKWLACGRPGQQTNQVQLVNGIPAERHEFLLYLPLYNGVKSVEIGLPVGAKLEKAPPRPEGKTKPIVFYGTSITQGGCASRPGMVHTAILGRWFDRPVINLGFSGNGRMEPEIAEFLAELDPAVYVIDCLPNITADVVRANTPTVVEILRKAHPDTPILLVEDRNYSDSFLVESKRQRNETSQAALREVYEQLKADGVTGLSYLAGDKLLGDDNEGTVDSSHPTDLGFMRQAEAFRNALSPLLK
jgi:hypothetical protein